MLRRLNSKGQFFILTTFVIVSAIYLIGNLLRSTVVIDTSKPVLEEYPYIFSLAWDSAKKVVKTSKNCRELEYNLLEMKDFLDKFAFKRGYRLKLDFKIISCSDSSSSGLVQLNLTLNAPTYYFFKSENVDWRAGKCDCSKYYCNVNCYRFCNVTLGDIFVSCDRFECIDGECQVYGRENCETVDCIDSCTETDNGNDPYIQGTTEDYDLCSEGDVTCPFQSLTDYCMNEEILLEYYCQGNDALATKIDCTELTSYACSDSLLVYRTFNCTDGACVEESSKVIENCDSYSWSFYCSGRAICSTITGCRGTCIPGTTYDNFCCCCVTAVG